MRREGCNLLGQEMIQVAAVKATANPAPQFQWNEGEMDVQAAFKIRSFFSAQIGIWRAQLTGAQLSVLV